MKKDVEFALVGLLFLPLVVACSQAGAAAEIGLEVAISTPLQDGEEFEVPPLVD